MYMVSQKKFFLNHPLVFMTIDVHDIQNVLVIKPKNKTF